MPAGVTGYQNRNHAPEPTYDYSRVFSRFGNLITLLCILTAGGLHMWTESVRRDREADRNAVALERTSLQSQRTALEADGRRVDEAERTLGPHGLGIPPVAPSLILASLKERTTGLGLVRISYVPAAGDAENPTIHLNVTAPSNMALANAVARLGERPFLNPTVSSTEDVTGKLTARITLEVSGSSESTGS